MSSFSDTGNTENSRRRFIRTASALAGLCVLGCDALGQVHRPGLHANAIGHKDVISERVKFKSGDAEIDGFLSRPVKKGRFPILVVVSGSTYDEEYIRDLTARFAKAEFVSISPNIFSLQKDDMTPEEKRKVFAEQITDENIFRDLEASINFLKEQYYVKKRKIGLTGFCFGGRCALMFASRYKEVDAVVPFYGNLRTPAFANRKEDPLDIAGKIKVPVQGHYSESDNEIPLDQLKQFESDLKDQGNKVQIFTYKAPHGFFAYNRKSYDAESAKLSWQRAVDFFNSNLK